MRNGEKQLFLITQKPYSPASKQTLAKWVKEAMMKAGLDLKIFTSHSLRSAATSAASRAGVSIQTILQTAGWSNDSTFRKYYNKTVNDKQNNLLQN